MFYLVQELLVSVLEKDQKFMICNIIRSEVRGWQPQAWRMKVKVGLTVLLIYTPLYNNTSSCFSSNFILLAVIKAVKPVMYYQSSQTKIVVCKLCCMYVSKIMLYTIIIIAWIITFSKP